MSTIAQLTKPSQLVNRAAQPGPESPNKSLKSQKSKLLPQRNCIASRSLQIA